MTAQQYSTEIQQMIKSSLFSAQAIKSSGPFLTIVTLPSALLSSDTSPAVLQLSRCNCRQISQTRKAQTTEPNDRHRIRFTYLTNGAL